MMKPEKPKGKKILVIHPFLLAIFPALTLVSDHLDLMFIPRVVFRIAGGMLTLVSLVFFVFNRIIKDAQKAGAILSTSLLLFSSYGYVFDALSGRFRNLKHRHLIVVWGTLEVWFVQFFMKTSVPFRRLTEFMNVVSSSLIVLSLTQIIAHRTARALSKKPSALSPFTPRPIPSQDSGIYPSDKRTPGPSYPFRDIYYLIVDGHASSSTLSEMYAVDNSTFVTHLISHGFFIAEKSRSNYAMTMLSLASSLNGDYLHALTPGLINSKNKNLRETQRLIEDNFSMLFLKDQGYKIVFLGSGFEITQKNRHADLDIQCSRVDEFTGRFIQSTLIRPFADRARLIENDRRKQILRMFAELARTSQITGPKFVFAHISSPQWPFLFDAQGQPTQSRMLDLDRKKKAYADQLTFIDQKITRLVDEILSAADVEPIIVIQSDHGPNFAYDPNDYFLQTPPPGILREKMGILNAYFLPDYNDEDLYESISPVNTFRLIFNRYFGTDFPLLDDQCYYSTLQFPYLLSDVSFFYHHSEEVDPI